MFFFSIPKELVEYPKMLKNDIYSKRKNISSTKKKFLAENATLLQRCCWWIMSQPDIRATRTDKQLDDPWLSKQIQIERSPPGLKASMD